MQLFDWIVLIGTLLFIVVYGAWKTKGSKNVEEFILGGNETPWYTVGLSVMATQASAITFYQLQDKPTTMEWVLCSFTLVCLLLWWSSV